MYSEVLPRLPLVQRKVKPDGEDVRRTHTLFFARAVLDEAGSPHFSEASGGGSLACMYLLPREDFVKLKRELFLKIEKFLDKDKAIKREKLYDCMGFPNNAKDVTRYRKLK